MTLFANILITIALMTVLMTLIMGFFAMMDRSPEARIRSNKLMRYRVYAQGAAILAFAFALFLKRNGG